MQKRKNPDIVSISGFFGGGRNRTRTCDPIDVNDVLYQLSHATIFFFDDVAVNIKYNATD